MPSVNQLTLAGHLCRDAERKILPSGTVCCEFSIAVNERYKKNEEWVEEVSFFDVAMFGKTAEYASDLCKGDGVVLTGKLKQERWEQDGQKRSRVKVIATLALPLAGRDDQPAPRERSQAPAREDHSQLPPADEIPFSLLWLLISISTIGGLLS